MATWATKPLCPALSLPVVAMADEEYPTVYAPPESLQEGALVKSLDEYKKLYRQSLDDPEVRAGLTHSGSLCRGRDPEAGE